MSSSVPSIALISGNLPYLIEIKVSSFKRIKDRATVTSTLALRTRHYYGQLAITDTPLLRTPRYYGHLTITDPPLLRTPRYDGHLAITDTPLIWTTAKYPSKIKHLTETNSRYYGLTDTFLGPDSTILLF